MTRSDPWSVLPHRWLHLQLPGRRNSPEHRTYEGSSLEALPPIPIELDEDFAWLMEHGTEFQASGLNQYERDIQPSQVKKMAKTAGVQLPKSFLRFMTAPELQSRVRSCTACYLDPGERIVETIGSIPGHLVHFLSDSQSCAHWYMHILSDGQAAVLESEDLYCYLPEHLDWIENPSCRLERVDLNDSNFAYCAPSFQEFLYRFWMENEIWYAEHEGSQCRLNALELDYLKHLLH